MGRVLQEKAICTLIQEHATGNRRFLEQQVIKTRRVEVEQHKQTKCCRADPSAGAADPAGDSVGIFTETMWIKG